MVMTLACAATAATAARGGLSRAAGRAGRGRLILARHAVPEVAVQDGLHHLAERTTLVRGGLVRGRAQRVVDLDRQVRTVPVRAGLTPVRERRWGLAVRHVATQLSRDPA